MSTKTSAPAEMEGIIEAFDEISGLCRHLRQGGPVPEDLQELSDALHEAVGIAANMLHTLAQQPAADQFITTFRCENNGIVGTTDAKIHSVTRHDDGRIEVIIDHWPKQPAVVDEAMVERAFAFCGHDPLTREDVHKMLTAALTQHQEPKP